MTERFQDAPKKQRGRLFLYLRRPSSFKASPKQEKPVYRTPQLPPPLFPARPFATGAEKAREALRHNMPGRTSKRIPPIPFSADNTVLRHGKNTRVCPYLSNGAAPCRTAFQGVSTARRAILPRRSPVFPFPTPAPL